MMLGPIKDAVKGAFSWNGVLNNWFYRRFGKTDQAFLDFLDTACAIDSIADVAPIKELRKKVDTDGQPWFSTDANLSNSLIYGIWPSLFSGFEKRELFQTPAVEHGLIFHDRMFTDTRFTARPSLVTFGDYRQSVLRSKTNRPVFKVGPYIHYATSYYDPTAFADLKHKYQKTLLVFPSHGTDAAVVSLEEKEYISKVRELAKGYDSVIVNVFWWNINDPVVSAFESEGFHIACAGVRDDVFFLSRLRTMIELADGVAGDGIGTHVGYALGLGVPYTMLPMSSTLSNITGVDSIPSDTQSDLARVADLLSSVPQEIDRCKEACSPYWGFEYVRTPEELGAIYDIAYELGERSKYCVNGSRSAALQLLQLYGEHDEVKYDLLRESLAG